MLKAEAGYQKGERAIVTGVRSQLLQVQELKQRIEDERENLLRERRRIDGFVYEKAQLKQAFCRLLNMKRSTLMSELPAIASVISGLLIIDEAIKNELIESFFKQFEP